jgi:hypothetical protein
MNGKRNLFGLRHVASSLLMLTMLTWLTVCLPFVNQSQKVSKAQTEQTDGSETESDGTNPLSNTNEEKSESGTSLLAEYLHEVSQLEHNFITLTTFYKCHPSDLYIAFHPELVIPPPEA